MPTIPLEHQRREKAVTRFLARRRPPVHLRNEIDLECRLGESAVEVVEIRPDWKDHSQKVERPIAKAAYVRASGCWKVYWRNRGAKWAPYDPQPQVPTLEAFFDVVDRDEHACFFG